MRGFFAKFAKNAQFQTRTFATGGLLAGAALAVVPENEELVKNAQGSTEEKKNISVNASDMKQIQYENAMKRI